MSQVQIDIHKMHDKYDFHNSVANLDKQSLLEFLQFRAAFLQEELNELYTAINKEDAEEVVDALVDLTVVAVGTLDLFDVDFEKAWKEVLQANLNKRVGQKASRKNNNGFPDLIKEPTWKKPNHSDNYGKLTEIFN